MSAKPGLPEFKSLLTAGLPELGPGPRAGVMFKSALAAALDPLLKAAALPPVSRALIRSLFLLWHDHFDAAHEIAQSVANADGSFLHGILHRREPDYGNAAYWFRRVGHHATFPELASRVGKLLDSKNETSLKSELIPGGQWDAFAFINLCEKAAGKPPSDGSVKLPREIQGIESEVLLEHLLA